MAKEPNIPPWRRSEGAKPVGEGVSLRPPPPAVKPPPPPPRPKKTG